MQKFMRILKSEKGQSTIEILIAIAGVVVIAVAITEALTPPVETLHTHTVDGITRITGSGL
jgi:hypothetical protein